MGFLLLKNSVMGEGEREAQKERVSSTGEREIERKFRRFIIVLWYPAIMSCCLPNTHCLDREGRKLDSYFIIPGNTSNSYVCNLFTMFEIKKSNFNLETWFSDRSFGARAKWKRCKCEKFAKKWRKVFSLRWNR